MMFFETSKRDGTCRVNLNPGGETNLCGREAYATAEFTTEEGETVYISVCKEHAKKIALTGVTVRQIEEAE